MRLRLLPRVLMEAAQLRTPATCAGFSGLRPFSTAHWETLRGVCIEVHSLQPPHHTRLPGPAVLIQGGRTTHPIGGPCRMQLCARH